MRRRLLKLFRVLSLLLCAALVALWCRQSTVALESVKWTGGDDAARRFRKLELDSGGGQLFLQSVRLDAPPFTDDGIWRDLCEDPGPGGLHYEREEEPIVADIRIHQVYRSGWRRAGLGWVRRYVGGATYYTYRFWMVASPMWALVLLTAVAPALHLHQTIRARRRERRGTCAACGYDLRASPGRCPECGWEVGKRL